MFGYILLFKKSDVVFAKMIFLSHEKVNRPLIFEEIGDAYFSI